MKNIIKTFFSIIILVIILILILIFVKSKKKVFDDITILGLWDDIGLKKEYEITSQETVEIDVFSTISKNMYKKIAPGSKGSFVIRFKRPLNSNYIIKIKEKKEKPQNLVFLIKNNKYKTLEEMEDVIYENFKDKEEVTINWEWTYYIDENHDIQDTKDGENAENYIFEISAIVEDQERTEI